MERETHFINDGSRYQADNLLSPTDGWAQLDTTDDAWYYGNWVNPFIKQIVSYTEGDLLIIKDMTDDEFKEQLAAYENFGNFKGIDDMCQDRIRVKFEELGLGRLLHQNRS